MAAQEASPGPSVVPSLADTIPTLRDEEAARRKIRRNRAVATGLLAVMATIFAATWLTPEGGFWLALLRAGSEAGIVGGLADWFAVTALFRHPLGLPIPHTAILPNNKDRIGRALGAFVERSFLTEAVVLPRLRRFRPGRRFAVWLASPEAVPLIVDPIVAALPQLARAAENHALRDFLNEAVGEQLRAVEIAPILGRSLELLTQSGEADVLFERMLDGAIHWVETNTAEVDRLVAERSRWWVPAAVDRRIARTIVDSVKDVLNGLRSPESETRKKFRSALAELIQDLMHSTERRQELNAARNRLLQHPELQSWLNATWTELSGRLAADLADPQSRFRAVLEKAVGSVGRALVADEAMQEKIDESLERVAGRVIAFRGDIARFMADVIRGWDAETLANRLELVIGSDLQFIRMNGTIVGALVGCVIFLFTWLAR